MTNPMSALLMDRRVERFCPGCHSALRVHPLVGFPICTACNAEYGNFSADERMTIMRKGIHPTEMLTRRAEGRDVDPDSLHVPKLFKSAAPDPQRIEWARSDSPTLLLSGSVGVGKTYQACGAMHLVLKRAPADSQAYLVTCASLYRLQAGDVKIYLAAHMLTLDDLGSRLNPASLAMALELLDTRLAANRRTIVTTNLPPIELTEVDQRLASRLLAGTVQVMTGIDRRLND